MITSERPASFITQLRQNRRFAGVGDYINEDEALVGALAFAVRGRQPFRQHPVVRLLGPNAENSSLRSETRLRKPDQLRWRS